MSTKQGRQKAMRRGLNSGGSMGQSSRPAFTTHARRYPTSTKSLDAHRAANSECPGVFEICERTSPEDCTKTTPAALAPTRQQTIYWSIAPKLDSGMCYASDEQHTAYLASREEKASNSMKHAQAMRRSLHADRQSKSGCKELRHCNSIDVQHEIPHHGHVR